MGSKQRAFTRALNRKLPDLLPTLDSVAKRVRYMEWLDKYFEDLRGVKQAELLVIYGHCCAGIDIDLAKAMARAEPLKGQVFDLLAEIDRLRKGIQDYLDGNWGTRLPNKIDKCPHGYFEWEACEGCIDEHFIKLLSRTDITSLPTGE